MKYLFFLLVFLCSCSGSLEKKQDIPVQQKDILPPVPKAPLPDKKEDENIEEIEEQKDDMEQEIYAAAHRLHSIFKIKAQGLLYHHKSPVYVLLQKGQDGKTEIILSEMLSKVGEKPIQVGKEWERHILSQKITILDKQREFWFDLEGNIDFMEEDKVFDVFSNPPQADIVLVPIEGKMGKKGMLDIIKKRTQISIYVIEK